MECYALGRDESSPSAYVRDGRYKDSGGRGGREVDIWQVAADRGLFGGDWKKAKEHYLSKYGVSVGRRSSSRRSSSRSTPPATSAAPSGLTTQPLSSRKPAEPWLAAFQPQRDTAPARTFIAQFGYAKRGFNRDAFLAAGGFYSTFPHDGRPREDGTPMDAWQHVVGLPVYGVALLDMLATITADPAAELPTIDDTTAVGAVIWQKNAEPFRVKRKEPVTLPDGTIEEYEKIKMKTEKSADALIGRHGLTLILADRARVAAGLPSQIDRIWKVEGPTDLLALFHSMTPDQRERQPIISTAGGSTSVYYWMAELIRGYDVIVVHDLDHAGEEGATKTCETWGPAAKSITPVRLPGEVVAKHGADIRDFLTGTGAFAEQGPQTFDDLDGLTLFAMPFTVTDDHRAAFAARLAGERESIAAGESPASPSSPQGNGVAGDNSAFEVNEAPDDPHRLARVYVEKYATSKSGLTTIRRWREEWHRWDGGQYRPQQEEDVKNHVNFSIKEEFDRVNILEQQRRSSRDDDGEKPPVARKVTRTMVSDVNAALAGMHNLPSDRDAPFWIDESDPAAKQFPADEIFASASGLIHLKSLFDNKPDFQLPPSPNFFSPNAVRYGFPNNNLNEVKPPKSWFEFLHAIWGDDEGQIELLQEWMGYCLLPDTSQQKIMLLIGPPRCGKGTIARVLTSLIGELNMTPIKLSQFDKEYGLWPLIGKTLAIAPDARLSTRPDLAQIVETLLSISGEDHQTVARKYLSNITTRLRTRFLIISNDLPALQDASGAFVSRCLLLRLTETFAGREDLDLGRRLHEELPGIFVWAAQGWNRLRERGYFVQPASSRNLLEELYTLTSPIRAFVEDHCDIGENLNCLVSDLYESYQGWCKSQGRHAATKQVFGRDLRSALPHITTEQLWNGGDRSRAFIGVSLKTVS